MSEIQKVAKKVLKDESEGIELLKDFLMIIFLPL